jgi:hypothetical protein
MELGLAGQRARRSSGDRRDQSRALDNATAGPELAGEALWAAGMLIPQLEDESREKR